jgi:hypothetical protein
MRLDRFSSNIQTETTKKDKETIKLLQDAGKMYRNTMFDFVKKKVVTSDLSEEKISKILEKSLGVQKINNKRYGPTKAVKSAIYLQIGLQNRQIQEKVITAMEFNRKGISVTDLAESLGVKVTAMKNVVGGGIVDIDGSYLESFRVKNNTAVMGNKIYAQMENGCQGNFVVLEVEEKAPGDCDNCTINKNSTLSNIEPKKFAQQLDRISDWEKRGVKRAKIADAIYNYFLKDTPFGRISSKHGLLNVLGGDINEDSPIPAEYLAEYKKYLSPQNKDIDSLTKTFTEAEMQKSLDLLQKMHRDALANNDGLQKKYKKIFESSLTGETISDNKFRTFWERLKSFTWETLKQSFGASLAASAVATLTTGNSVGVAVVFVEFFRSTIGAKTKLQMASVEKLDMVAEHARLYKKYSQKIEKSDSGGLKIKAPGVFSNEESPEIQLLLALDAKILERKISDEEQELIDQYLAKVDTNKCHAQNLYQTVFSAKDAVEKVSKEEEESVNDLNDLMTDPVRESIEERRKTYEMYRKEVGEKLFDAVQGQVNSQDIFSEIFRGIGNLLGRDPIDTPEEAYQEIDTWIDKYENENFEYKNNEMNLKAEFVKEMNELNTSDPDKFDEEMKKLERKNKEYLTALQLRSQLFNASRLAIPREGSVIFTQAADILDRLNDEKRKQEDGLNDSDKEFKNLCKKIKPSIDAYLRTVSQVYEALDPVINSGSGFSLKELDLEGDAHLSVILGSIRENVESLNEALNEALENNELLKSLQENLNDNDDIPLLQQSLAQVAHINKGKFRNDVQEIHNNISDDDKESMKENVKDLITSIQEDSTKTLLKIIGDINQSKTYRSGNESTYGSLHYLEDTVLPKLRKNPPNSESIPEWVQRVREEKYKKESQYTLKVCELAPEDYAIIPYTDDSSGIPIGIALEVGRYEKTLEKKTKTESVERSKEKIDTKSAYNNVEKNLTREQLQKLGLYDKWKNGDLAQHFENLNLDGKKKFLEDLGIDPSEYTTHTEWTEETVKEVFKTVLGWTQNVGTSPSGTAGGMATSISNE